MDSRDYFAEFGELLPKHKVDKERMVFCFTLENDEREETDYELPMSYCVCDTCRGRGKHVNPSIDAHGITGAEWEEWDPDDRAAYRNGAYDVVCAECRGARVVPEIDADRADPAVLKILQDWQKEESQYRSACKAERRMGC